MDALTKNDIQRLSNHVKNNNSTLLNDKVNNSTYASAGSSKPDVSNYVCAFCHDTGHAIWRCEKYLKLNLEKRLNYIKRNERCMKCLGRHNLSDCPSIYKCYTCSNRIILLSLSSEAKYCYQ